MQGNRASFRFCSNLGLLFQTTDDTVYRIQKILLAYKFLSVTGCDQRSFIADIRNVRTGESRSLTCQQIYIYCIVYLDRAQVYAEYFFTFVKVGQVYVYLTVETSGTKQCLVKYVHTVGSGKDNHTTIGTEAVHFSQQLIQSVFTLIISTHCRVFATSTAYRVNFIDKDNTRSFFFSLLEQVTYAGSTYTDKHFYEVGTCQ